MIPYEEYIEELRKFPVSYRAGVEFSRNDMGEIVVLLEQKHGDPFYGDRWATPGGTILPREDEQTFWTRHESEMGYKGVQSAPAWIFAGVLETPNTVRHHGIVLLYGRIWDVPPPSEKGMWITLSHIDTLDCIPSCRESLSIVYDVLFEAEVPGYRLSTVTDA